MHPHHPTIWVASISPFQRFTCLTPLQFIEASESHDNFNFTIQQLIDWVLTLDWGKLVSKPFMVGLMELELGISIFFGESATDDIGQPAGERHQNGEPRHFYHFVHYFLRICEILYENGCVHELSTCIVRTLQWCIALQWALFVCIFKALALPNVSSQRSRKFFFGWRPSPVTSSVHQLAVSTTSHLSDPT